VNTLVSRLRRGHSAEYELLVKHAPCFFRHNAKLRELGFTPDRTKAFLEIGTGWDVNAAYFARLAGYGEVITVDAFVHLDPAQIVACLKIFPRLATEIAREFGRDETEVAAELAQAAQEHGEDFLLRTDIRYVAPISTDYHEIESVSKDVVYSSVVMEHLSLSDVKNTLAQIRRILKPGGYTTHIIDLSDHFACFHPGLPYNHFLRFSDKQWAFWADNPLAFTNRLLASDWENLFQEAGFDILFFQDVVPTHLPPLPVTQLSPQFRSRSARDLEVGEIHVVARRPT